MYSDNEPEWTEENKNKERGSSNLEQCGWCEYASGSHRYSVCISGRCSLMKTYDKDITWDSDCRLKKLGSEDVQDIIRHKEYKINENVQSNTHLNEQIELLKSMAFENIPILPTNRKHDHFDIGDKVMLFNRFTESLIQDRWVEGEVINGYRHHDGCVSTKACEKIHNGEFEDGYGTGSGLCIPTIILKSEYDYFKGNPDKFVTWIKDACDKTFNGEIIDYKYIPLPN